MNAAARGRISEDTPWEPPSMEEAKNFEDELHLRHPEGGKFDVREAAMGRYCFLGGCGEQFDLWDEVRTRALLCLSVVDNKLLSLGLICCDLSKLTLGRGVVLYMSRHA